MDRLRGAPARTPALPAVADPLATVLLGALARLTGSAGDYAGLSWGGPGRPCRAAVGFALAARTGDGADAFALALVALGGPRLALVAAGTMADPPPVLAGGWSLRLSGELAGPVQAAPGPTARPRSPVPPVACASTWPDPTPAGGSARRAAPGSGSAR